MKKSWIVVSAIAGLLAVAMNGGTVLAQNDEGTGVAPAKTFVTRVVEILKGL